MHAKIKRNKPISKPKDDLIDENIEKENASDDKCAICDDNGKLIICDRCQKSFHIFCVCLTDVPTSEFWYCAECDDE